MVFSRYLPEGYRHECTVHILNTIACSYYSSEEGRRLYGEGMDYVNNAHRESYKELTITIYKHPTSEKYYARERYEYVNNNYDPNALLLTINSTEGVAYHDRLYGTNNIWIFYDDHTYRIEGRLNMDEIIKIARSLD